MPVTEVRIAGFGGQGVILAASIIGRAAAIHEGNFATMTQNFGPEARGGACSAQLVLSNAPVLYPYVTHPDILAAMSQEAYTRFVPELKDGSLLLVEEDLVRVSGIPAGVRVYGVPATRLAETLGRRMVLNVVMVGFFGAISKLVSQEALRKAVADSVPAAFSDLNLRAFDKGFDYGVNYTSGRAGKVPVEERLQVLES
jgi:2-oxoglutarate ferredoxin oxidoreductase subunit gamma